MKRIFYSFLFLFSVPLIISQNCGLNPPRDPTDCFNYQANGTDCCFLFNDDDSLCLEIQSPNQFSPQSSYTFNNTKYHINCNVPDFYGQIGTVCGVPNPQNSTQCIDGSSTSNNCCYYDNATLSYCFWLGESYTNEIIFLTSSNNTNVICYSELLNLNIYKIVLILAFLFIF